MYAKRAYNSRKITSGRPSMLNIIKNPSYKWKGKFVLFNDASRAH